MTDRTSAPLAELPGRPASAAPAENGESGPPAPDAPTAAVGAELVLLQQHIDLLASTIETERAERKAEAAARQERELVAEAERFAGDLIQERRIPEDQRSGLVTLYVRAARDDRANPTVVSLLAPDGSPATGTRVDALRSMYSRATPVRVDRSELRVVTGAVEQRTEEFLVGAAWGE